MALLVALTQWLTASGALDGTAVGPDGVAAAFLAIAAASGGVVALRYSDFVYPAVISTGVGSMFIAQRGYDPNVAADAFIVSIGMLVVVGLAAIALARKPRQTPRHKKPYRSTKVIRKAKNERWYLIEGNTSIMRF